MSRVTVEDVWSLPDPVINHNFNLIIPNIPGGGNSRRLNVACSTASLPGPGTIATVTTEIRGHVRRDAGKREQDGSLSFTLVEGVDFGVRSMLLAWMELARSLRSQGNSRRSVYAVPAYIEITDGVKGDVLYTEVLRNAWLSTFSESDLSTGDAKIEYPCTLVFDINERVNKVGD